MASTRSVVVLLVAGVVGTCFAPNTAFAQAPPPPFKWSGFYVGANGGYGGGDGDTTFSVPLHRFEPYALNTDPKGWTWGAQGGVNFQIGRCVMGAEADFTKSGVSGSVSVSPYYLAGTLVNGSLTSDQRLKWVSTFRGRLGLTLGDVLVSATAGGAIRRIESASSISDGSQTYPLSERSTSPGFTVGFGVEGPLTPRMTWRAQYLLLDVAESSATDPQTNVTHTWRQGTNMFSGGVNFRF